MDNSAINLLIQQSIENSYSYSAYKDLIAQLLEDDKSTGTEQSEQLTEYSKLNQRRMKRWDKTLKIKLEYAQKFQQEKRNLMWLVISEGWCGDAAHALPVINKLAELNESIQLKIVLRDENEALMNQFLTNGGKSIPKLIVVDLDQKGVLADWGPRPTEATKMVQDYKAKHGQLDPGFKEDLQRWYNKDRGNGIVEDLVNILFS
jgi:hypothetical protein